MSLIGYSPAVLAAMSTAQVQSWTTADIASLTTDQLVALRTDQIVALTSAQVPALTSSSMAALTSVQVVAIESQDVTALKTSQVAALSSANVALLTSTQVQALTSAGVAALTTAEITALSSANVAFLSSAQSAALTATQAAALSSAQLATLSSANVGVLSTAAVAALSTANVALLSTAQVIALTTSQVKALTTNGIAVLTTSQISAMESTDVAALTTTQVRALTTADIVALSSAQVQSLTMAQVGALTTAQQASITTAQAPYLAMGSPIILDLNGDGVKTLSFTEGVKFDLFADGTSVNTGWVSASDGLLVLDRNHDGSIGDGSELFGTSTTLSSGQKASDGYAALRELDSNSDGIISKDDDQFADLRIWVDSNSDGITESGETRTLDSLGITRLDLTVAANLSKDNGNLLGLTSTYETADGLTHAAADVWFVADKSATTSASASVDSAIAALNGTNVVTVESAPIEVLKADGTGMTTLDPQEPVAAGAADTLRTRVSSLAQAIGSFGGSSSVEDALSAPRLDSSGGVASASSAATQTVVGMADAMKQFDANGNLIANPGTGAASLGKTLNLPGVQDPANNGFLTTGGSK